MASLTAWYTPKLRRKPLTRLIVAAASRGFLFVLAGGTE